MRGGSAGGALVLGIGRVWSTVTVLYCQLPAADRVRRNECAGGSFSEGGSIAHQMVVGRIGLNFVDLEKT